MRRIITYTTYIINKISYNINACNILLKILTEIITSQVAYYDFNENNNNITSINCNNEDLFNTKTTERDEAISYHVIHVVI